MALETGLSIVRRMKGRYIRLRHIFEIDRLGLNLEVPGPKRYKPMPGPIVWSIGGDPLAHSAFMPDWVRCHSFAEESEIQPFNEGLLPPPRPYRCYDDEIQLPGYFRFPFAGEKRNVAMGEPWMCLSTPGRVGEALEAPFFLPFATDSFSHSRDIGRFVH